jgi:hypothetical protein
MALILLDALPNGSVLINTDQIIQARLVEGEMRLFLADGHEVAVPHEDEARLLQDIEEAIAQSQI